MTGLGCACEGFYVHYMTLNHRHQIEICNYKQRFMVPISIFTRYSRWNIRCWRWRRRTFSKMMRRNLALSKATSLSNHLSRCITKTPRVFFFKYLHLQDGYKHVTTALEMKEMNERRCPPGFKCHYWSSSGRRVPLRWRRTTQPAETEKALSGVKLGGF